MPRRLPAGEPEAGPWRTVPVTELLGLVLAAAGEGVSSRPPQGAARGCEGTIEVLGGLDVVLVEGTGASHAEHTDLVDATVWVQADFAEAERRGIARDVAQGVNGDLEEATAFWHSWMAEELTVLARQRPRERACAVVDGTPPGPLAPNHVRVAPPLGHGS